MKQSIVVAGFTLTIALIILGCSASNQLAAGMVYDAKVQVRSAKEAGAQDLAKQEFADAQRMLSRSEEALSAAKEREAYRLGRRASLKAKIAEALAIANRIEAEARAAEQILEAKVQTVESARRKLEQVERELEALQSTPD